MLIVIHANDRPSNLVASPHFIDLEFIQPNKHEMQNLLDKEVLQFECQHSELSLCPK